MTILQCKLAATGPWLFVQYSGFVDSLSIAPVTISDSVKMSELIGLLFLLSVQFFCSTKSA